MSRRRLRLYFALALALLALPWLALLLQRGR